MHISYEADGGDPAANRIPVIFQKASMNCEYPTKEVWTKLNTMLEVSSDRLIGSDDI